MPIFLHSPSLRRADARRRLRVGRWRWVAAATVALASLTACAGGEADDPAPDTSVPQESQEPADERADGGDAGGSGTGATTDGQADAGTGTTQPDGDANAQPEPESDPDPEAGAEAASDTPPDLDVATALDEVARLDAPTAGAVADDGVIYLTERAGAVHPLGDDGVGDAVVDLRGEVSTGSEQGLLGIAFAPDGGEMYLSYTDVAGDSVVAAYPFSRGRVDRDERRTVFTHPQPYANHNGGDIRFGPDGHLYIALGDGGGAGDPLRTAQDLSTPLGSLLRIDPDRGDQYAIPSGNPFVDEGEARAEIYAYGLRNPWRFSFDRVTGDLWIADVGQRSREEINRIGVGEAGGANFGWSLMEGEQPFAGSEPDGHVPPVHTYETTGERCAVTGGFVYRGEAIPALRGAYLYSDYCEGVIRALVVDGGEIVDRAELGIDGGAVVSFVEGPDGELYVLDLNGTIFRLEPA